jgi:hypothetical protein
MAGLKQMTLSDLEPALEQAAKYYRKCPAMIEQGNCDDAYEFYKHKYRPMYECFIKQGFCYTYKKNYLIACDPNILEKENPEIYSLTFDYITAVAYYIKREENPVLFLTDIGPRNGEFFTRDTYEMLNLFDKKYGKYTILTMAPEEIDFDNFSKYMRAKEITVNGVPTWRWS